MTVEKKKLQYQEIIDQMTLEDKIALCSGKDFWHTKDMEQYGIPSVMMTDGPHGVRKQKDAADMLGLNDAVPSTCFPTAVTTGATWNRELIGQVAEAIGEEAKAEDVAVVLGPGVNIKRNPLCGRNFEYISEDPYLSGEMGAAYVEGLQKTGIGTSLKHFAVNSQEYKRFSSDSQIDERTLREIYLPAFENVVKKSQPKTVMCAYPRLNGTYCSDNKKLLTDILRDEWGFKGMVVTDWGAMNDRVQSFEAGCDLSMPGGSAYGEKAALEAVRKNKLDEHLIDVSVDRILKVVLEGKSVLDNKANTDYDKEKHQELAEKAATEGAVLLKNDQKVLPIDVSKKLLVVGWMAKELRYQGAGSSHISPTQLDQPIDEIKKIYSNVTYIEGCDGKGIISDQELQHIENAAKEADVVLVFAGLTEQYESEGFDRDDMQMPKGHNQMIEAAAKGNKNTVVLLLGGSVMKLPWFEKTKALLYMGLPGQAGGRAVVDIISGKVSPSGKLTETWPYQENDIPSYGYYAGTRKNAQYREGIYVGYRYYDKADVKVQFPFGYGLSYTKFNYSDLIVETVSEEEMRYQVQVTITNCGDVAGAEIAQLYIKAPQTGIDRAVKELKGFEKVFLMPGESKRITFSLDKRSFAVYQDGWKVPAGDYVIQIGASLEDIRENRELAITSQDIVIVPEWVKDSFYANPKGQPSKDDWEKLMGKEMEDDPVLKKGNFEINNTLLELKNHNSIAKKMATSIEENIAKGMGIEVDYLNPEFRMAAMSSVDCSMRGMIITSCGQFPEKVARMIVEMANGHKIQGVKELLKK